MTEKYLSHQELSVFLTNPTPIATSLLPSRTNPSMSYFYDNDNLNPYPATSANGELDQHLFLNQPPTIDPLNLRLHNFPTDRLDMIPQLGPIAGSMTTLPDPTGSSEHRRSIFSDPRLTHETSDSVVGTTSYGWGFGGHTQPSHTDLGWPTTNPQPHPGHHDLSGWGNYPSGTTLASVASTTIPTPSSGKNLFHCTTS